MKPTMYDEVGGEPAIRGLVGDFYQRVFADPELRPFFDNAHRERLERMQLEFFSAALGGPVEFSGTTLRDAHAGYHIGTAQLTLFTQHLLETMTNRNLSPAAVDMVIDRISRYADDIVGGSAEDG